MSDILEVRTADHVELELRLSYRVSFTARSGTDDARWFNVSNYVALLCDHLGSIVRAAVRATPIDRFHASSTELIRSAVLGEKKAEKRTGREFEENGMMVYDVEVLALRILDADVEALLTQAQRNAIQSEVTRKNEALRLASEEAREAVNRALFDTQRQTVDAEAALEGARRALLEARATAKTEALRIEVVGRASNEAQALDISSAAKAQAEERLAALSERALAARVSAFSAQMAALQPELISTLKTLGHQQLAGQLTEHLGPLAILGGTSVAEVAERLLAALPVGADGVDLAKKALRAAKP